MTQLYVVAEFAGQRIAVDATLVEAVVDIAMVAPVPLAPPHVVGLAAIRSQVLTVIDPAPLVGAVAAPPTGRALVLLVDGHRYAIRVDTVDDVTALAPADRRAQAAIAPRWAAIASDIVVVGDGYAVVVDPACLVAPQPFALVA